MDPFIYSVPASRVVFGRGSVASLAAEVERLGARRVLTLCGTAQEDAAQQVAKLLGERGVGLFAGAVMHVPGDAVTSALQVVAQRQADCVLAFGGGSVIGLAKALGLRAPLPLPIIAVPTTYAGSEVTPIYGITEGGVKTTGRDARVLPRTVIYDAALTETLPVGLSMTSGINAMAHAAEALYAHDGNPVVRLMAASGLKALARALPQIKNGVADPAARDLAFYGSWLCGTVLGQVSMGLHHKLCHTLGGSFNLPHAETHAVILAHAMEYNYLAAPAAMAQIEAALGVGRAPQGLFELAVRLDAPRSLRELGMPEDGLELVAELAVQAAYPNPRALERQALRGLLQRAYEGLPPSSQ